MTDSNLLLIRSFKLDLEVSGLAHQTRRNYSRYVERLADAHEGRDVRALTSLDLKNWYSDLLAGGMTAKTLREIQIGLRKFYRFLFLEDQVEKDPTANHKLATYHIDPQKHYTEAAIKSLLLVTNQKTRQGCRDKAMVMTLIDSAVRVGELVSMTVPDLESVR